MTNGGQILPIGRKGQMSNSKWKVCDAQKFIVVSFNQIDLLLDLDRLRCIIQPGCRRDSTNRQKIPVRADGYSERLSNALRSGRKTYGPLAYSVGA